MPGPGRIDVDFGGEAAALAREVCRRSVTLVRNERGALPLRRDVPTFVVWPEVRQGTEVDEALARELTLGRALAPYLGRVKDRDRRRSGEEEDSGNAGGDRQGAGGYSRTRRDPPESREAIGYSCRWWSGRTTPPSRRDKPNW